MDRDLEAAVWSTAFVNNLPDSSFAVIEPGGSKDGEGKTTPRSLRHLPYKDASGSVDLPHLRNALARLPQTNISEELKSKARTKLENAAKEAGVGQAAALKAVGKMISRKNLQTLSDAHKILGDLITAAQSHETYDQMDSARICFDGEQLFFRGNDE